MTPRSGNDVPESEAETREESAYEGRADNPASDTQAATRGPATGAGASQPSQPDIDVTRGESKKEGGGA